MTIDKVQVVRIVKPVVSLKHDMFGGVDIMVDDFAYVHINYDYRYTDNASRQALAEKIAAMLGDNAQAREIEALRNLAATCYAGLGAECNLPEAWLDVLNAAANGESFSTEGLLPFTADSEAAALRPDAERYRLLRAQHWNDGTLAVMRSADLPLGVQTYSGALLDDAIAAIGQQGKKTT